MWFNKLIILSHKIKGFLPSCDTRVVLDRSLQAQSNFEED